MGESRKVTGSQNSRMEMKDKNDRVLNPKLVHPPCSSCRGDIFLTGKTGDSASLAKGDSGFNIYDSPQWCFFVFFVFLLLALK